MTHFAGVFAMSRVFVYIYSHNHELHYVFFSVVSSLIIFGYRMHQLPNVFMNIFATPLECVI